MHREQMTESTHEPISSYASADARPRPLASRPQICHRDVLRENLTPQELCDRLEDGAVLFLHRNWRAGIWFYLALAAMLLVVLAVVVMFPEQILRGLFAAVVVSGVMAAMIINLLWDQKFEISGDLITAREGIRSGTTTTRNVPMEEVGATEVDQRIDEKVFGIGDLRISDVIPEHKDVIMRGLHRPGFYGEVMSELIRRRLSSSAVRTAAPTAAYRVQNLPPGNHPSEPLREEVPRERLKNAV